MITKAVTDTIPHGDEEQTIIILWEIQHTYKENACGCVYPVKSYSIREVWNEDEEEIYYFQSEEPSTEWEYIFNQLFEEDCFRPC